VLRNRRTEYLSDLIAPALDHVRHFSQQPAEAVTRLIDLKPFLNLPGQRDVGMKDRNLKILLESSTIPSVLHARRLIT
jgi:hypothetical protein